MFPYDQFPDQVSSVQTEQRASSYKGSSGTSGFFEGCHVNHIIHENKGGNFSTSNLSFGSSKYVGKKVISSYFNENAKQRAYGYSGK